MKYSSGSIRRVPWVRAVKPLPPQSRFRSSAAQLKRGRSLLRAIHHLQSSFTVLTATVITAEPLLIYTLLQSIDLPPNFPPQVNCDYRRTQRKKYY
jgi:hypothetical protein